MNDKLLYELFGKLYDHEITPADAYLLVLKVRKHKKQ